MNDYIMLMFNGFRHANCLCWYIATAIRQVRDSVSQLIIQLRRECPLVIVMFAHRHKNMALTIHLLK